MKSRLIQLVMLAALAFGMLLQPTSAKQLTPTSLEQTTLPVSEFLVAPERVEDTEFVLVNATSVWLSLYIDGERTVTVNPGDKGVTMVAVGTHTFRAVAVDSNGNPLSDGRSVQRTGYVPPAGVTWTVHE